MNRYLGPVRCLLGFHWPEKVAKVNVCGPDGFRWAAGHNNTHEKWRMECRRGCGRSVYQIFPRIPQ